MDWDAWFTVICLPGINKVLKAIYSDKFLGQEILIKIRISTGSSLPGDWTAAPLIKSNRGELWLPWLTCGNTFSSVSLGWWYKREIAWTAWFVAVYTSDAPSQLWTDFFWCGEQCWSLDLLDTIADGRQRLWATRSCLELCFPSIF